ncbi:glycyl-radical enzyme activating protein [Clostridium sp. AM29-11AC]|uniref:glycyl-radical enzyme activating protein n=1 Tax=Clostridium sp. AM29-11AC TaxID=2293028 RepID=UPI0001CCD6A1|nr:glycyl-radical enzyme activating protein [Clostridium sp. AM29-11AC]RHT57654.1 glycyl-radical enzyme activating protein [Clostridium sp. AM29-11AC]CBK77777.1 glycerol dehydratase, cobalamin-independent, small subunit [[Clostridium] cf. saccharolyticum K10]
MDSINYNASGTVFDIQRFSLHDGPGIRTIVFLKGCPLSCKWCSNPESQKMGPVIMYKKEECLHCGRCAAACRRKAISFDNKTFINREFCTGCGECANACPAGALVVKGKKMTVQQLIRELKKDATTYRRSGGGITLSGGEPLVQYEFAAELLKACQSQGWDTAIETTGAGLSEAVEQVIPYVDTVLLDIKHLDTETHRKFTGIGNEQILKNAARISEISKTVIRVPVIPGFNCSEESIRAIAEFAKTLRGVRTIHLLPYHTFGENKYGLLGRDYELADVKPLKPEELETCRAMVEKEGFQCIIGG